MRRQNFPVGGGRCVSLLVSAYRNVVLGLERLIKSGWDIYLSRRGRVSWEKSGADKRERGREREG